MRAFVGITHSERVNSSLKREALVFDQIGIYDLNSIDQKSQWRDELDWLLEQGIVFNIEPKRTNLIDQRSALEVKHQNSKHTVADKRVSVPTEEFNHKYQKLKRELKDLSEDLRSVRIAFQDITCRTHCLLLRERKGFDAFPLFCNEKIRPRSRSLEKADVVRIVLNALPIPSDETSWEQIIEYRSDPNSLAQFFALRRWMTKTAKAELSATEIEEELEWLLYDYQRHLDLHRLEVNLGAIETILTVGAAFLENLVTINWSEAVKLLFTFKHRKIELLKAEMKSPGSEVAYVLGTWKRFSAKPNLLRVLSRKEVIDRWLPLPNQ